MDILKTITTCGCEDFEYCRNCIKNMVSAEKAGEKEVAQYTHKEMIRLCDEARLQGYHNHDDEAGRLSIVDVYTMAISSLPPIEFEALEKILVLLCETRRLMPPILTGRENER